MKNKCFKDNVKLQQQVDMLSKRANVYKQRWLREKKAKLMINLA